MVLPYNKGLKSNARRLRKTMTGAEQLLWSKVRRKQLKGFQFYRQQIIKDYIVDFYCPKVKLAIELDGGQHYTDEGREKDGIRDEVLRSLGLKVLRFSDADVLRNIDSFVELIWNTL